MKKWKKGNFYTNLEDWELYKKSLSVINPIPKSTLHSFQESTSFRF